MGQTKANLIAELWARNYLSIGTDNVKAAAFQIDIWEIINETNAPPNNIRTGDFYVSSDTATLDQAQTWLNQLTGTGRRQTGLIALTSGTYQDYVVQGVVTPAPAGWMLGLIGSFGFLFPVAWRSRKQFLFFGRAAG